jgi:hypothetical protein
MALLAGERTRKNVSLLLALMHSIIDYYIRFYMYRFGIYDSHPDRGDIYGETYVRCVDLVGELRLDGIVPRGDYAGQLSGHGRPVVVERGTANFNRIKRYLNKSIAGWIYNRVFKRRKRDIELTKDEAALLMHMDLEDNYGEVETAADIETIERHLESESAFYVELCSAMTAAPGRREKAVRQYRDMVYASYSSTGRLPGAEDVFAERFGGVFGGDL